MSESQRKESIRKSRQKAVGDMLRQNTRDRLLQAAEQEFRDSGYAGTTVAALAGAAGVSVQTLYLAWGSTRALLRGYMEHVIAGGSADPTTPEDAAKRFARLEPQERLIELAALVAEVAGRAALGWRLYRDASAVDPEVARDWDELQMLRHRLFSRIIGGIPSSALAESLTSKQATDTAWAIASPESHELLVHRLGYSLEEFRAWMARTLVGTMLAR